MKLSLSCYLCMSVLNCYSNFTAYTKLVNLYRLVFMARIKAKLKAMPTNHTDYSSYIKVVACITNYMGSTSCHQLMRTHVRTHTHMHAHSYTLTCMHKHTHTYTQSHARTHTLQTDKQTDTHTHAHTHTHTNTHMYTHTHTHRGKSPLYSGVRLYAKQDPP